MERLNNSHLIYADCNYIHSVNYCRMYNAPITLNYGLKHNRKKFIIGAGTSDNIELWQDGVFIYVLSQNNGMGYISLQVINTETNQIEDNIFLGGEDATDILEMESKEQLTILFDYCN